MYHHEELARLRRQEAESAAALHRLARAHRPADGPSQVLRLYARLWRASRPPAAARPSGLRDVPA